MDFEEQHSIWIEQVGKLVKSKVSLAETNQNNILSNFFSQAIESEFRNELDTFKTSIKHLLLHASERAPQITGTTRERAAMILPKTEPVFPNIRLSDIRNMVVFEIYKRCGHATETYFERYSSPPGTREQNQVYSAIAHGNAKCTAQWTEKIRYLITALTLLKRFFTVYDTFNNQSITLTSSNLNWFGTSWVSHIDNRGLGDLVWDIFLDLWTYENLK